MAPQFRIPVRNPQNSVKLVLIKPEPYSNKFHCYSSTIRIRAIHFNLDMMGWVGVIWKNCSHMDSRMCEWRNPPALQSLSVMQNEIQIPIATHPASHCWPHRHHATTTTAALPLMSPLQKM